MTLDISVVAIEFINYELTKNARLTTIGLFLILHKLYKK